VPGKEGTFSSGLGGAVPRYRADAGGYRPDRSVPGFAADPGPAQTEPWRGVGPGSPFGAARRPWGNVEEPRKSRREPGPTLPYRGDYDVRGYDGYPPPDVYGREAEW